MENNTFFEVLNKDGDTQMIDVILYFSLDTDGNDYIIYKDLNETDKDMLYASQVIETNDKIELNEITDKEIISQIKDIIEEIKEGDNK